MVESLNDEVQAQVAMALASRDTGWSVGEFGAIGEFHHAGNFSKLDGLTVDTAGGSLRVMPGRWKLVAYQTISGRPRQWLHGVAFCLPVEMATMSARSRITELGIDAEAIAQEDRNAVLFDPLSGDCDAREQAGKWLRGVLACSMVPARMWPCMPAEPRLPRSSGNPVHMPSQFPG